MKKEIQEIHKLLGEDKFLKGIKELETRKESIARQYYNGELNIKQATDNIVELDNKIETIRKEEQAVYNLLGLVNNLSKQE